MNSQDYIPQEIENRDPLADFFSLDESALAELAQSLRLSLRVSSLRSCRNYYRSVVRRVPTEEELVFIDRAVKSAAASPDSLLLTQMTTESDTVAETFADLMTRRTDEQKANNTPLSLSALSALLGDWLAASGKDRCESAVCFSRYRDLQLAALGYRRSASTGETDSDISIGIPLPKEKRNTNLSKGDYVYAILWDSADDDAAERATDLLIPHAAVGSVKAIKIAQDQSLIPLLAEWKRGMTVYAEKLATLSITALADCAKPQCGVIFIASPERSTDLLLNAQERGLRVFLLAKITDSDALCIRANGAEYRFPIAFFHTLALRAVEATIANPEDKDAELSLSRLGSCTIEGKRHAVVKTEINGNADFQAALLSVVYALAHCVAVGVSLNEVRFAANLTAPFDARNGISQEMSAILGLYRAQAEFALAGTTLLSAHKADEISLSTVLLAPLPEDIPSAVATKNGTRVYYLEPRYTADGIPDLHDLKKLFSYVSHLIADGKALSVRPVSTDLAADLAGMGKAVAIEPLSSETVPSRIGGFLVETETTIQGVLIAKTEIARKCEADS